MNTSDVRGTFREMWETRPARPRDDRQIAGVAAAIARRYDIDPVLVRIGFVVAAFFGIGAALYIAGWLVLPDTPSDPAVPESRKRGILVVGLVIATIVSAGSIFGGHGRFVLPLVAALALLFLLHRSRGDRGPAGIPPSPGQSWPPQQAAEGVSLVKGAAPADGAQQPPSWDPLGAAPFAWDLPEPGPATPPPPRPRRRPVTLVTLGLALLAGAVTGVVLLGMGTAGIAGFPVLLGVVAAVLGLGLVVGSFLRAGRGLIPFAVLVSILIWGALSAPWHSFGRDGFGDLRAAPTTVAQLQPDYRRGAGDVTLDLRALDLSGTGDVRTGIDVGAGDARVLLPPNADVTFTGEAGLGDVTFDGRKDAGPGAKLAVTNDLGVDGVRSGKLLTIDVHAGAGDVEVSRG